MLGLSETVEARGEFGLRTSVQERVLSEPRVPSEARSPNELMHAQALPETYTEPLKPLSQLKFNTSANIASASSVKAREAFLSTKQAPDFQSVANETLDTNASVTFVCTGDKRYHCSVSSLAGCHFRFQPGSIYSAINIAAVTLQAFFRLLKVYQRNPFSIICALDANNVEGVSLLNKIFGQARATNESLLEIAEMVQMPELQVAFLARFLKTCIHLFIHLFTLV